MGSLSEFFVQVLAQVGFQLLWVAGPLAACGAVLHLLERMTTRLLVVTFGWSSVLWTGVVGTPVHELSHAAMCLPFGHRIDELALFRPDAHDGLLGYVRHSYNPRNPWALIGNAFIGVAPLFGGALVLYVLVFLLGPEATATQLSDELRARTFHDTSGVVDQGLASLRLAWSVLASIVSPENLWTWRFWLLLYLVVCVGGHMAPSPTDLRGSRLGLLLMLGLLVLFDIVLLAVTGGVGDDAVLAVAGAASPVVALLVLAIVLNTAVLGVVYGLSRLLRR